MMRSQGIRVQSPKKSSVAWCEYVPKGPIEQQNELHRLEESAKLTEESDARRSQVVGGCHESQ